MFAILFLFIVCLISNLPPSVFCMKIQLDISTLLDFHAWLEFGLGTVQLATVRHGDDYQTSHLASDYSDMAKAMSPRCVFVWG